MIEVRFIGVGKPFWEKREVESTQREVAESWREFEWVL